MILLVASSRDPASKNIRHRLLAQCNFDECEESFHGNPVYRGRNTDIEAKLVTINAELSQYPSITNHFSPELIVCLSRHCSQSGIPTLSVHTPGYLHTSREGGATRISIAPANSMKWALAEMMRQRDKLSLDYQVSYECTHHGPSLNVPTMFVELGSSASQWEDTEAAGAVAQAAMAPTIQHSQRSAGVVGIGGPHYNRRFTQMALVNPVAFGHIIPKYAIPFASAEMIRQCVERTDEKVEKILLDWKGIRGIDKPRLTEALEEVDVPIQRI